MKNTNRTAELLLAHYRAYPHMTPQDLCKLLHQSTFGCEHLVTDEQTAIARICEEMEGLYEPTNSMIEPLDGDYSRVHLGYLKTGLSVRTLARLLCLSSEQCTHDVAELERKLDVARGLVITQRLPFDPRDLCDALDAWKRQGYAALHHSDAFRKEYRPTYRVIHNRYVLYLPLLARLDSLLSEKHVLLAIEGGSAAGKSTLGELLHSIYDCTVCHMDDFFLRPEQRTPERLAKVGGNIDIERFLDEVLIPLKNRTAVKYRRYDCSTATILPAVEVIPTPLTVIEGAYSMHPLAQGHYDLTVFLDVSPDTQRRRIQKRNSPPMAQRFFSEWIPMEQTYFTQTDIRARCDMAIPIMDAEYEA